ncbi:flavin mononucleotide hydrolase 1, chloroplatic-like isoform X2 [Mangifera indica]|uniref:flavin mononucleotide hydrolase 1, chloroplatic-like isoform X2 n=1 Tax=Mangifera indica TaxID=29780 RepID=UPI001CFB0DBC|nr:flavin mononucleotide hydrolase 1, chloroplatic-like isoform X2 [Mangifera indica]
MAAAAVLVRVPATLISTTAIPLKPPYTKPIRISLNPSFRNITKRPLMASLRGQTQQRKLPILLFDIMDTIVRDPFYQDVPAFFGMPMKELIEQKHPTAWIEFEKGLIDEIELARNFFKDGRSFDLEGLKNCMKRGYCYIEGVEELLSDLKQNNYEMHAFTNYPIWYRIIEDKLKISTYLSWTFCSCAIESSSANIVHWRRIYVVDISTAWSMWAVIYFSPSFRKEKA